MPVQWYEIRLRWAVMAERKGLREWIESVYIFRSGDYDAAAQHAIELGRRQESSYAEGPCDARCLETRFAEVVSLDCLGTELRDDMQFGWRRWKATEKLGFHHEFYPERKQPESSF